MIVAKVQEHGLMCVCSIWTWILNFVCKGTLSLHFYGYMRQMTLEDGEVLQAIQEELSEKLKIGFIKAQDVCDIVASEKLQVLFSWLGIPKPSILQLTAQRWLAKMKWRYSKTKNGMYIGGHEREDVMAYRHAFVHQWADYEARFQFWDDNGNCLPCSSPLCPLVLITHDESVFFQNDKRKTNWNHQDS